MQALSYVYSMHDVPSSTMATHITLKVKRFCKIMNLALLWIILLWIAELQYMLKVLWLFKIA